MYLIKKKTLSAKILTSGLSFLLLFSNFPQEVLAGRSNAGGGKAAKFDAGKVAMSIGIAVGSAAIGGALSSAWSSSSQAAQQSAQTAQEGMKILQEATPLLHSPELLAVTATAGQATQTIPLAFLSASSSISTITPITQEGVQLAQAAGQAVHAAQTASTLSKFTQPFVNLGKGIYNAPSTMKFIAQNPSVFAKGATVAFKTSNIVPTVIKGYNTYVAVTQVNRAVGTMASYKSWEPASTFLVSTVATMTTAGFLNPAASLGDSLSETSSEFAMPTMLKGAGVGALGGLAGAGLTIAVDADKMNKDPRDRSRDRSPTIGGRILGMAGTMLGITLGRTLVDPKTYNTKLEEYVEDEMDISGSEILDPQTGKTIEKMKIYTSKTGDFISEKDLNERTGVPEMERAFRAQLGKDGKLDIRSAQQLLESATPVGEGFYRIEKGSNSVTFHLPEDKARFLESMRFAPSQEVSLKPGPGAEFIPGETPEFKGSVGALAQGGVRGGVPPGGRTVASVYLPQNISGSSLPLQRIFLNPLVETFNQWPLLAANALEIVVREKVISGNGQQSIWQPLISGAVMALAAPVFESLANTYKLKPSLFSDIDQKLGYFPELQYARAEMFKDAIVRKGADFVSKVPKEELTKKPTQEEIRKLEDEKMPGKIGLAEAELDEEMNKLLNPPLTQTIEGPGGRKVAVGSAMTQNDPIGREIKSREKEFNEKIDLLELKQKISLPVDLMERFSTTEQIQILSTLQAAKGKATIKGKNWTVGDTRGALLEGLMAVANTRGAEKAVTAQIASSPSAPRNDHSQDVFDHRPVLESMGGSRMGIVFDRTKDVFRYDLPVSLLSGIMEVGLNEINGVNKIQRLENKIAKLNSQKVRYGKDLAKIEKMEEKIDSLLLPSMLTSLGANIITDVARGTAVYLYGKHLERKQKDEIETFGDRWEPALLTQRSLTDPVQIILARIEGTIPLPDDNKYDYKAVEYYNPETGERLKPEEFKEKVLKPILTEAEGKVDEESYEVLKELDLYTFKRKLQNERAAASLLPSLREKSDALNKWEEIGNIKENPNGSFKLAPGAEIPIDSTRYYGRKTDEGVKLIASEEYRNVIKIEGYARSLDPDTLSPAKAYFLLTKKVVPLKDYDIAKVPPLGRTIMGNVNQGLFEFGWKALAMGLPHRPEGKLSAFEWYSYTRNLSSLASASGSAAAGQGYANTMLRHQANVATGMSVNNLFTILNEPIDLGMAKVVGVSGYKKGLPGYEKGLPYNEAVLLDVGWNDKEARFYPYWPFYEIVPVPNDHFWGRINKGLKKELKKELGEKALEELSGWELHKMHNPEFYGEEKNVSSKEIEKYKFPIPPEPKPEDIKPWGPDSGLPLKEREKQIDKVFRPKSEEKALEELSGWELHKMHNPELYEKKEILPLTSLEPPDKAEEIARQLETRNNKSSDKSVVIRPFVSAGQKVIDSKDIIFSTEEDRENEVIRQEDIIFSTKDIKIPEGIPPLPSSGQGLHEWWDKLGSSEEPSSSEEENTKPTSADKTPPLGEDLGFSHQEVEKIIEEGRTPPKIEAPPPLLPKKKIPEGIPPLPSSGQGLHEWWDKLGSSEEPSSSEEENTKPTSLAQERIPKIDVNPPDTSIESAEVERGEIKVRSDPNSMTPRLLHEEQLRMAQKEPGFFPKVEAIKKAFERLDKEAPLYVGNDPVTKPTQDKVISDGIIVNYSTDYTGPLVIGRDLEGNPIFSSNFNIEPLAGQDLLEQEFKKGRISQYLYDKLKNKEIKISPMVIAFLDELDQEIKKNGGTIELTSGYRNPDYQVFVSGLNPTTAALDSRHPNGDAVDFRVTGLKNSEVYQILQRLLDGDGGIGFYEDEDEDKDKDSDHWHVDLRKTPEGEKPARWDKGSNIIPKNAINDPNTYPIDKIRPVVDGIKKEESGRGGVLRTGEYYLWQDYADSLGPFQINDNQVQKLLRNYPPPPDIQELISNYQRKALEKTLTEGGSPDPNREMLYDPEISRWLAEVIVKENFDIIAGLAVRNGQPFTTEDAQMITAAMYNQGPGKVGEAIALYNVDKLAKEIYQSIEWYIPEPDMAEHHLPTFLTSFGKRLGLPIGTPASEVREKRLEQTEEFLLRVVKDGKLPGITYQDVQEFVTRHFSINGGEQITTSSNERITVPANIGGKTIVQLLKEKGYTDLPSVLAVDGKLVRLIDGDYRQYGIAPQALYSNVFKEITKLQGDNFKLFPSPEDVKKDPPAGILSPLNYGLRVVDGLGKGPVDPTSILPTTTFTSTSTFPTTTTTTTPTTTTFSTTTTSTTTTSTTTTTHPPTTLSDNHNH